MALGLLHLKQAWDTGCCADNIVAGCCADNIAAGCSNNRHFFMLSTLFRVIPHQYVTVSQKRFVLSVLNLICFLGV